MTEPSKVDRLLRELRSVGLNDVDAHRAAFCALALARGWPKARIGRYMGISRARVGQKADKLRDYADHGRDETPTLVHVMAVAGSAAADPAAAGYVEFRPEDWDDLSFARGLCENVA